MILANLRPRIGASDLDLVIRVLADGDDAARRRIEREIATEGVDRLLDREGLPERLRSHPELGSPSAHLFIYVTVRHALLAADIDDATLSDYLGALILEFGKRGRAFRIAEHDDASYRYLVDIVDDLSVESGRRGFLLSVHLGNFSLWLAGIFPDHVTARNERRGAPGIGYYDELGARGFSLAAEHRLARQLEMSGTYRTVADSFHRIRVALNHISDRLLFPSIHTPGRLLRQVADGFTPA
ncbi:MAG: hypothetical protein OEO20_12655 [Gemmatimonadota bacterium]|nr:hypothetical protein [Gemmatimonadota bacterium]MDH3369255.1 hypothetical protein [Gemmatimonadota bacterium]MDH3479145.1 hypothetical protein [Gemmatimonadota bacterium]MDH3569789.1 hypothetical protein [Gemmatimonadota bacterium]MDH5548876.1 hypothetical protein [Gemmatimonadota bacterium]